jgi:hypothetical protein
MSEQESSGPPLARAIVVSDEELPEAKKIARMFMALGIIRAAFSDPAAAAEWEKRQAELWLAEARQVQRPSR